MTKTPLTLLYLPVLTAGIILSSCSTILRKQTQKVYVFSSTEGATVTVNDSLYKLPAHVEVKRDRTPVKMEYKSAFKEADSLTTLFNYQLTPVLYAGVRYNPSVYSFRNHGDGFDYEHVIGFDFRLKF